MVKLFYQSLAVALSVYCGGYLLEADALALDSEVSKEETAPALPVSKTSDEVLHVKKWAGFQAPRLIVGVHKSINKASPFFRGQMRDQIVTQVPKQDIEATSVLGNTPAPNKVWLGRLSVEVSTEEGEIRGAGKEELMDINSFSSSVSPAYVNRIAPASKSSQQTTQIAQVNSVSELTDVQPTDWAFGALQSLVER